MGLITVMIQGSFGRQSAKTFSAMEGGHAMAISQAISHLANELPHAIQLDHKLAEQGDKPPKSDFGKLPEPAQIA